MLHPPNPPRLYTESFAQIPTHLRGLWLLVMFGSVGIGLAPAAIATPLPDRLLLAQQVVDGLPPPPPILDSYGSPLNIQSNLPAATAEQYLVYINGSSPLLLEQVQRVASQASIQDYEGQSFIQAGVFPTSHQAEQQVAALAAQGIGADVVTVPTSWTSPTAIGGTVDPAPISPTVNVPALPSSALSPMEVGALPPSNYVPETIAPREIEFGRSPSFNEIVEEERQRNEVSTQSGDYYVVIPGDSNELGQITSQVAWLGSGIPLNGFVEERSSPLGPHVMVGPFVDRNAALRWSQYFQDFGMNARVYYQR